MSAKEGLTRIAQVIRWTGQAFAWLTVAAGAIGWISNLATTGLVEFSFGALFVALLWFFFMYASKALAWIIDGFAKDK